MTKIEDIYLIMKEALENGNDFVFPIEGTSMRPLLKSGDKVKVTTIDTIKKGDIVLYRRESGQFVIHRIRKVNKDKTYNIVGDHQRIVEKNVKRECFIAKAVSYKKKGKEKEYQLKGFKYGIYKFLVKSCFIRMIFSKIA